MAKKAVVEIQCDRCPRREYIDPDTTRPMGPTVIRFGDQTIEFTDLCGACYKAVAAHVEGIGRRLEGRSPERAARAGKAAPKGATPPVPSQPAQEPVSRSSGPRVAGPGRP